MSSFNRVILMGNVTRDIELRYTPGGKAVCDLGLAINDRKKDANGAWVDETTFVDIVMFDRTAEVAAEYLKKGSPLLIEGRLKLEQWTDRESGQRRQKLKVVCDKMQLLGGKNGERRESGGERQPTSGGDAGDGGDIPF